MISIPRISEYESVFILRAQDILTAPTIEIYRILLESHGSPMVKDVEEEIKIFKQWNGSKKMPD
jgi:hypothetical protein